MIDPKKALKIILAQAEPFGLEKVATVQALDCILAENIHSDINIPPFNRAAMDGFAVSSKDPSQVLKIIEDIPAGKVPQKRIKPGQCARIMTGALLPKGADKVVKVENTEPLGADCIQITALERKSHVARAGEDVRKGRLVLKKGTRLRPQEVAMLATVGRTKVTIYRRPQVAVISTGSELVEPQQKPKPGQIRNSNSSMLLAQLKKRGIEGRYLGIAKDRFAATRRLISKGLAEADVLLLSGGVSVGDYDFVRDVLQNCGVKILFDRVAIQPGKPTVFGTKGKKLVFGLPGNPVSVLIVFKLFVGPALDRAVGRKDQDKFFPARLLEEFQRREAGRELYYPVKIKIGGALPLEYHGSAHMQAFTQADGIMKIKKGVKHIRKGAVIDVRPL